MHLPPPEELPSELPTVENRIFHPFDIRLRRKGWKIYARPKHGPTKWEKDGKTVTEAEALNLEGIG